MEETEKGAVVHGRKGSRLGKGFSRQELQKAGLTPSQAVKLGIRIDIRRKTVHDGNIETAKLMIEERKRIKKPKVKG